MTLSEVEGKTIQALPDNLKAGIENLSGYSMNDVKVHRNSDKPGQLQAHAYAQGTDIHLGPGQEKHLPHEAWHVVQQKQGRVKPTMQMKGNVNVNDDVGLEKEANVMGQRATTPIQPRKNTSQLGIKGSNTIQKWAIDAPGAIDWAQTASVTPLVHRPVMFFEDVGGDRIVVKGEEVSIGKTLLANMLHHQIHGADVVYTRDITGDKNAINAILDDPGRSGVHADWENIFLAFPDILPANYPNLANLSNDEKGRKSRQVYLTFLPKLQVMNLVPGKSAQQLATPLGNAGGYQTFRSLLTRVVYVEQLGKITAVDLFLENDDRLWAGNLGNWMNDAEGNITLIDQLNNNARTLLNDNGTGDNGMVGPMANLNRLAPAAIPATATACLDSILHAMATVAGDDSAATWADDNMGGQTRRQIIEAQLVTGIRAGVKELVRHLKTYKRRKKGRTIKDETETFEQQDTLLGNPPLIHFWDRLKARGVYLDNL